MNLIQIGLILLSAAPPVATFLLGYQLMRNGQGIIGSPSIQPVFFYFAKIGISVVFALLFMVSIKSSLKFYFPLLIQNEIAEVQQLLSLIFLLAGNLLLIPAYLSLGIFTRVGLPQTPHALNTSGIYKISRNPMYTSFFFFETACFLLIPSLFLLMFMVMFSTIHHFIILKEETFLSKVFPVEYNSYKKSVARYL